MDIFELGKISSLALTYQAYLQELNARNIGLAGTETRNVLDVSFSELLQSVGGEHEMAAWRTQLENHTRVVPSSGSLDEISVDAHRTTSRYNAIVEAYGRTLQLYKTALGRG